MDVGVVLSRYDEDNNYAVFGFGGQPGRLNLSKSQTISPRLDEIEEVEVAEENADVSAEAESPADVPAEDSVEIPAVDPAEIPAEDPAEIPVENPAEAESPADAPAKEESVEVHDKDSEEKDSSSDSSIGSRRNSEHSPQEEVQIEKTEESQTEAMPSTATETPEKEESSMYPSVELRKKPVSPPPRSTFTRTFSLSSHSNLAMTSEEKADQEAMKLLQASVEKLRAESNYLSRVNIDQNLESEELSVPLFPMNGNHRNPYIHGIDNILKAYRRMLRSVMPSYPTYFQHVISEAIEYSLSLTGET